MIHRFYTLILGAMLSLFSGKLEAQSFSVVLDSFEVQVGQKVCVPIKAKGFVNMLSLQYAFKWSPQVLKYAHTQNYNLPGMSALDFFPSLSKYLVVTWGEPSGQCITKPDGEILYEVCFIAIGSSGDSTIITVGSDGLPPNSGGAEAYNCSTINVWSPGNNDTGFIRVVPVVSSVNLPDSEVKSFQLYPNPTQNSSRVTFHTQTEGNSTLLVSNTLGQIVLEQKISVNAGENRFEIPAKALAAKGMYQISLKTDLGISTQMLSVQ